MNQVRQRSRHPYCSHSLLRWMIMVIIKGQGSRGTRNIGSLHINTRKNEIPELFSVTLSPERRCRCLVLFSSVEILSLPLTPHSFRHTLFLHSLQGQWHPSLQILHHLFCSSKYFLVAQLLVRSRLQMQLKHSIFKVSAFGKTNVWY